MGCEYFQDKTNIKSIELDKDHSPIYYGTMTKHIEYKLQDKKTGKLHNYTYRHNRFNGEAILLTLKEADKYDAIINNERAATEEDELRQDVGISELWNAVRRDLDWFRKHNAKAYMVLLD